MTLVKLREAMINDGNDIYFVYNEKNSGVETELHDGKWTFSAWHGEDAKEYSEFDDMINDDFYSGKSILNLLEIIEIDFV